MKRWTILFVGMMLAMTLCSVMLSLTIDSSLQTRATLSQVLIFVSLGCFVVLMALRSHSGHAEAVAASHREVAANMRQSCGFSSVAANEQALQSHGAAGLPARA